MCDIQKWIKKHIDVFKLIFIFPLFLGGSNFHARFQIEVSPK